MIIIGEGGSGFCILHAGMIVLFLGLKDNVKKCILMRMYNVNLNSTIVVNAWMIIPYCGSQWSVPGSILHASLI